MRAWAEINLDNIVHNISAVRSITDENAKILAVVKADAYGHGFFEVAKVLLKHGVDYLGVATVDEAVQLRTHGIKTPVLILGSVIENDIKRVIGYGADATVFDYETAKKYSNAAIALDKTARVHIKIDTGMTRVGFRISGDKESYRKTADEIKKISKLPNLVISGIFTHFARADEADKSYTDIQYGKFIRLCDMLKDEGIDTGIRHCCNSAGIVDFPDYHLDMVRSGIITYGHYPSDMVNTEKIKLLPAMQLKSTIVNINHIEKGVPVSYGGTFVSQDKTDVATISIGYADGYYRTLSNRAEVLIGGSKAKIVGNVCMDQSMADVTGIKNIKIGDEVILFGADGNNIITVESVAELIGTINYEVLCVIGKRVPRVYIQNGNVVSVLNYLV